MTNKYVSVRLAKKCSFGGLSGLVRGGGGGTGAPGGSRNPRNSKNHCMMYLSGGVMLCELCDIGGTGSLS